MDNKQNPEVIIIRSPKIDPVKDLPPYADYRDGKENRRLRREKERQKRKARKR